MKVIYLILTLISILIQGCSASGPKFSGISGTSENESLVYIYRMSEFFKGGTYPFVYIDGQEIGPLRNGGYLMSKVSPGNHHVEIKGQIFPGDWTPDPILLEIETKEDTPTFIKLWIGFSEMVPSTYISLASSNAAVVDAEYALEQIKQCNYSD